MKTNYADEVTKVLEKFTDNILEENEIIKAETTARISEKVSLVSRLLVKVEILRVKQIHLTAANDILISEVNTILDYWRDKRMTIDEKKDVNDELEYLDGKIRQNIRQKLENGRQLDILIKAIKEEI